MNNEPRIVPINNGYKIELRGYRIFCTDGISAVFDELTNGSHVSDRDVVGTAYEMMMEHIPQDGTLVEVGPGFGGLVPLLIDQGRNLNYIVIDPINYIQIVEMLDLLKNELGEKTPPRVYEILQRCQIYTEHERVTHIQLGLKKAVALPELNEIADVVIDHYGPSTWSFLDSTSGDTHPVEPYLLRLCNSDGLVITGNDFSVKVTRKNGRKFRYPI